MTTPDGKRVDVSKLDDLAFWKSNGAIEANPQKRVNIPAEGRLDVFLQSQIQNSFTLPVYTRSGMEASVFGVSNCPIMLDGRVFAWADFSGINNSNIFFALVPRDAEPTFSAGAFSPTSSTNGFSTSVDFKTLAPTLVTNGTTITTGTAGANNVGPGNRVYYSLCVSNPNTTAADVAASVGLYGHTSGNIYAICLAGASVSGYFDMTQTAEKIDIKYTNPDSVDHTVAASYSAVSP